MVTSVTFKSNRGAVTLMDTNNNGIFEVGDKTLTTVHFYNNETATSSDYASAGLIGMEFGLNDICIYRNTSFKSLEAYGLHYAALQAAIKTGQVAAVSKEWDGYVKASHDLSIPVGKHTPALGSPEAAKLAIRKTLQKAFESAAVDNDYGAMLSTLKEAWVLAGVNKGEDYFHRMTASPLFAGISSNAFSFFQDWALANAKNGQIAQALSDLDAAVFVAERFQMPAGPVQKKKSEVLMAGIKKSIDTAEAVMKNDPSAKGKTASELDKHHEALTKAVKYYGIYANKLDPKRLTQGATETALKQKVSAWETKLSTVLLDQVRALKSTGNIEEMKRLYAKSISLGYNSSANPVAAAEFRQISWEAHEIALKKALDVAEAAAKAGAFKEAETHAETASCYARALKVDIEDRLQIIQREGWKTAYTKALEAAQKAYEYGNGHRFREALHKARAASVKLGGAPEQADRMLTERISQQQKATAVSLR